MTFGMFKHAIVNVFPSAIKTFLYDYLVKVINFLLYAVSNFDFDTKP